MHFSVFCSPADVQALRLADFLQGSLTNVPLIHYFRIVESLIPDAVAVAVAVAVFPNMLALHGERLLFYRQPPRLVHPR
jgi:hypothetical protein